MKYKIQAYWTKQCEGTIEVEAESQEEALETAHEEVMSDPEAYEYSNWDDDCWWEWDVKVVDGD